MSFRDAQGRAVLCYSVQAWDAQGKSLSAQVAVVNDRVNLAVEDAKAVYPITIDPVFTSLIQKLSVLDNNSLFLDGVGAAVALSGVTQRSSRLPTMTTR